MTEPIPNGPNSSISSFTIQEKWIDIATTIIGIACLTIGGFATAGYLNGIGAIHATYLSYGMYGAATLAFMILVAKILGCGHQTGNPNRTVAQPVNHASNHQESTDQLITETIEIPSTKTLPSEVLNELKLIKAQCPNELQTYFEGLHALLRSGEYVIKLDYYTFYYQLSTISEQILKINNPILLGQWQGFLTSIDGLELKREGSATHQLDCSFELRRLRRENIEFKMEKIEGNTDKQQADLRSVKQILIEAFEGHDHVEYPVYSTPEEPCFVIREGLPEGTILGCIFLKQREDEIYVHSLARKASAVRLGITEQFTAYLKQVLAHEKQKKITCAVYKDNALAIRLYLNIGFRFTAQTKTTASMIYNPTAPINSFNDAPLVSENSLDDRINGKPKFFS